MSEHTKEPWHLGKYNKHCVMGNDGLLIVGDYYEDREKTEANARRIVACVNACAEITNNELEIVSYAQLLESHHYIQQQRDKLLAALKGLIAEHVEFVDDEYSRAPEGYRYVDAVALVKELEAPC